MNWRELKDKKIEIVGGAVSGGLDSCTVTHWLSAKGFVVHCFTVDLGQPDEESLDAVRDRMIACGAQGAEPARPCAAAPNPCSAPRMGAAPTRFPSRDIDAAVIPLSLWGRRVPRSNCGDTGVRGVTTRPKRAPRRAAASLTAMWPTSGKRPICSTSRGLRVIRGI